jgi:hypothetical protein
VVHPLDCHVLDGRHTTEPVGELSRGRTGRLERDIRAARSCFGAQTSNPAAHDKHRSDNTSPTEPCCGAGAAWVFTRSGSTWAQRGAKFRGGAGRGENGRFGASVALSANSKTALIGEDGENAAWVFESEP